ncbi:MAG: Bug family tripartite tricarboxylate transporter substrate binding protein [Burkholderiales bacterium]
MTTRQTRQFLIAVALAACASRGWAQAYPAKPVRIVIPIPAGGPADALIRAVAPELSAMWKQPVVIDNRPGASGIIGTDIVAKSAADGHTILYADSSIAVNQMVFRSLPYDTMRDLTPVSALVTWRAMIVVNGKVPVDSLQDLVTRAKANPGKLNYASYGVGSSPHIALEMFKQLAGIDLVHVPYKGASAVLPDIISGTVQVAWMSINSIRGAAKEGRVKVLAVDGIKRMVELPDVPTFNELGYAQMQANAIWLGLFVPAGTAPAIVDKLYRDVLTVLTEPSFKEQRLTQRAYELIGSTPEQLTTLMRETAVRFAPIIKSAGIVVE